MNVISMAKAGLAVAKGFAVANAPIILIGAAAVGVISVAVTAWKCGKASQKAVEKATIEKGDILTKKEEFSVKGKYIAAVVASVILCVGSMGAGFYLEHKALCEMTATANTLLANNKTLNAELQELENLDPPAVQKVKSEQMWNNVDKQKLVVEYGDVIYDEFLERSFRMPIEVAMSAVNNFRSFFGDNGYGTIKDLYDFMHKNVSGTVGNLGWFAEFGNHNDLDYPFIGFKEEQRELANGDIESVWIMSYYPQELDIPRTRSGYNAGLINDDELMSTIGNAFA